MRTICCRVCNFFTFRASESLLKMLLLSVIVLFSKDLNKTTLYKICTELLFKIGKCCTFRDTTLPGLDFHVKYVSQCCNLILIYNI